MKSFPGYFFFIALSIRLIFISNLNQEYKKATGILEDLYKVNPRYRGLVITLSNIYLQQRNYDKCEHSFDQLEHNYHEL